MILECASKRAFSADAGAKSDDDSRRTERQLQHSVNPSFSMQWPQPQDPRDPHAVPQIRCHRVKASHVLICSYLHKPDDQSPVRMVVADGRDELPRAIF